MTRQIFRKYTLFILSTFHFIWGQISDFKVKEYFPLPHRISELGLKPTKFNWSVGDRFILIDEVKNQIMNVNLNGPFHLTKTVLKDMVKNKNGRIINISSISGTDGNKGQGNYAASKGGLLALTKSLAKEVGRRNITVNCIAPGLIETDMISHLSDTIKEGYLDRIPLKKLGKPKDIGQMILFLCSEEASYITGQTFYIDGGMSLN